MAIFPEQSIRKKFWNYGGRCGLFFQPKRGISFCHGCSATASQGPHTMKAFVYEGPGVGALEDRPKPGLQAAGDAVVAIAVLAR
jgi:hypothetical protein